MLLLTAVLAVIGATALTYSPAASWFSDYNQSLVVSDYNDSIEDVEPSAERQLRAAQDYNDALSSGATLEANTNVPTGNGTSEQQSFDYWKLLRTPNGTMARIQIPSIDVDLPIYHGTSEKALLEGAGHLQGTSLPIGGADSHSVITAHRGLADSTMFTNLDKVAVGDRFILTTFGRVLTYEVTTTRVVEPTDTAALRQEAGRDLVTLVTCTPLGINTHRILVTGKRITPTPAADLERAKGGPAGLGFPWWSVLYLGALALIGFYIWWGGRVRAPRAATGGQREGPAISYDITATRARATGAAGAGGEGITYRWPGKPGTLRPRERVVAWTSVPGGVTAGVPVHASAGGPGRDGASPGTGFVFTVVNTGETTMTEVTIPDGLPGLSAQVGDWQRMLDDLPAEHTVSASVTHRSPGRGTPKRER